MTLETRPQRLHSLDAVRAVALLAGVVLHAAMAFLPGIAESGWPIADRSPSVTLGVIFYVIHQFRMTLFFALAGFFAHMLLHRRGLRAFASNRAGRILLPLVAGWVVIFPLVATAMSLARSATGTLFQVPPNIPRFAFPLAHLWFLYVLLLLYAGIIAVRYAVAERDSAGRWRHRLDTVVAFLVHSNLAALALAIPTATALVGASRWQPWFGIPTPDQSLIPNLPAFIAFATAFTFGWCLHRQTGLFAVIERRWLLHLTAAVAGTVISLAIVGTTPRFGVESLTGWSRLAYTAIYTVGIWAWTFGLIGAALRFCARPGTVTRYVSDASYWVYLAHLPIVFLLEVAVQRQPWHWTVKFGAVLGGALIVLFTSYQWLVRNTVIGDVLNGPRRRDRVAITPSDANRPRLATLDDVTKRYGATVALDGLSLDVRAGELVAVLGPNGAGKTTAISMLLGLQEPESGVATLFGQRPADLEPRYRVGVMMQEAALPQELRVRELIALTAAYYPSPMSTDAAMKATDTAALADRQYGQLSGGQKRQVQFALALCGQPALLFLDEPTVGLDIQSRERLWTTLRQLVARGTSIVLTTHYLEEAEALADRVVVVAKGRVIATGTVDELRSIVARKRITCTTRVAPDVLRTWPGVKEVSLDAGRTRVLATDADAVVRQLLATDITACDLEVQRAGLGDAFTELTQEAA